MTDQEVFQKYDRAMAEYAKKIFPAFPRDLAIQRKPYQPFLKMVHDFYIFCSYLADNGLFPEDKPYLPLRTLFAKGSLAVFGVFITMNHGLSTEASALLRSHFESYLNVKLILAKDAEERMILYDNFRYVEQWNNLQANRSLLASGKLADEDFKSTYTYERIVEVEQNYQRVKSDYHSTQPYHWAWKLFRNEIKGGRNPSIRFVADKVDLSFDYVKVYGALSISVHNSPSLLNLVGDVSSVSLAPRFTDLIYDTGVLAVDYMACIIEELAAYLNFGAPNEISTYVAAFSVAVADEAKKRI
jgi:hypothetical protein